MLNEPGRKWSQYRGKWSQKRKRLEFWWSHLCPCIQLCLKLIVHHIHPSTHPSVHLIFLCQPSLYALDKPLLQNSSGVRLHQTKRPTCLEEWTLSFSPWVSMLPCWGLAPRPSGFSCDLDTTGRLERTKSSLSQGTSRSCFLFLLYEEKKQRNNNKIPPRTTLRSWGQKGTPVRERCSLSVSPVTSRSSRALKTNTQT